MRFRYLSLSVASLLLASPARAEEAGLPQLDTTLFPEQLFWLAISFAVLYVLMSRVALPRVAKTQANRKQVIAAELDLARKANDKAKAAMAAVEKSMTEVRAKAQTHVNEMMTEVSAQAASRHSQQEKDMLRKLHTVEADIAVTRQAALKAIHASTEELASAIVEKILGSKQRGEI